MAVPGKCYLSLQNTGRSANRGECMQICRRSYIVKDRETDIELEVDNKYIMSPKDLKTLRFLDQLVEAGVRVFKIEGRARGPEYVKTVVECYSKALDAILDDNFNEALKDRLDARLASVFNRGFWDGYYQGQRLGEWTESYGSQATERKVYVGRGTKYYSRLGLGEFHIEAAELHVGDKFLITGPTTGALYGVIEEMHDDSNAAVPVAHQGSNVSFKVGDKIRHSDKLFRIDTLTPK